MCTGPHPYIPADRTAQVALIFQGPGGMAENIFNFIKSTEWSVADVTEIATHMIAWWKTNCIHITSLDYTLVKAIATDLGDANGPQAEIPVTSGGQGTETTEAFPSNVTVAIKLITPLRGRSFRGRNYFVGLPSDASTGDTLDPAYVTAIHDAWATLVGPDSVMPDTELAIVSRCADHAWRTTAVVTSVTDLSVDNTLDSQRRRLAGRGV